MFLSAPATQGSLRTGFENPSLVVTINITMLTRNWINGFGDFALNLFSILGIGSIDDNYQVITSVVPAQFRGD